MTMLPNELLRRAREATGLSEPTRRPAHTGRSTASTAPPRRVPFVLLVTGLVVGSLALLLALNTASAANELQRHALVQRDSVVGAQVQDLTVEVAASAAPANLAAAAAALGMVPAGNPAFVVIGPDGAARVMGHPEPVTAPPVAVPAPRTTPKPTPKPTATPKATPSGAKPSSTPTGAKRSGTMPSGSPKPSPKPSRSASPSAPRTTPRPSPTPTPVVTLPGGAR